MSKASELQKAVRDNLPAMVELGELRMKLRRLVMYVGFDAECPKCRRKRRCLKTCTLSKNSSTYEELDIARWALYGDDD